MGKLLHLSDVPETVHRRRALAAAQRAPRHPCLRHQRRPSSSRASDADIEHDESDSGHQEVYVVVSGRAAFRLGDEEVEAGPGDVVAVPDPAETRDYRAIEPGTRIVCLGAAPGAEHPYGEWIGREAQAS